MNQTPSENVYYVVSTSNEDDRYRKPSSDKSIIIQNLHSKIEATSPGEAVRKILNDMSVINGRTYYFWVHDEDWSADWMFVDATPHIEYSYRVQHNPRPTVTDYTFSIETYRTQRCKSGVATDLLPDASNLAEVLQNLMANPKKFERYIALVKQFTTIKQLSVVNLINNEVDIVVWWNKTCINSMDYCESLNRCPRAATWTDIILAALYIGFHYDFKKSVTIKHRGNPFYEEIDIPRPISELFRKNGGLLIIV